MITIIAGTNRKDSNTKKVAEAYKTILSKKNIGCKMLGLDEVNVYERNELYVAMEKAFLLDAEKIIIVLPEYNGSFQAY